MNRLSLEWVAIGAIGAAACGRPHGTRASQDVDVSQPPSISPTSQPPFPIEGGKATLTPDADYSVSGLAVESPQESHGTRSYLFRLVWGANADPRTTAGPNVVGLIALTEDANLLRAIKSIKRGQHVRVSGWRCPMEVGGKTVPSVKGSGGELVTVFPTELQIDDTVYAPSSLPAGAP